MSDERRRAESGRAESDGYRTVLKFDAGRRGFGRAMVALAVAALVLLGFSVFFLWPVFGR